MLFDAAAQALHMDVEGLGVADVVAAPQPVDELVAGEHPARVAQQHFEELELAQRQGDCFAAHTHDMPVRIKTHRAGFDDARHDDLDTVTAAPKYRSNTSDEFTRGERLRDVVVSAELEADDLVDLAVSRGQHDDGHVASLAQPPADFCAGKTRAASGRAEQGRRRDVRTPQAQPDRSSRSALRSPHG